MFERIMIIGITFIWAVMTIGVVAWLTWSLVSWVVTGILRCVFAI